MGPDKKRCETNTNPYAQQNTTIVQRIKEDTPKDTEVLTVRCLDDDKVSPQGTIVKYTIVGNGMQTTFSITTRDGLGYITLLRKLNYETEQQLDFQVECTDGGNLSGRMSIKIVVVDINE